LANGGTVHALFALLGGMHQERKLSGGAGTSGVEAATAPLLNHPNRPYSLSMSSAGSSGSNVLKCNYKDKQAGEAAAIEAVAAALGDGHPRVMHNSYGYCLLTFETSAAAAAAQVTLSRSAFFSTVNFKQDASASGEPQAMTFQHTSARPTPTSTKFRRQSDEAGGPAARPGEADPLLWHCAEMPTPLIAECAKVLGWDVLADAIAKAIEPEPFFTLGGQAAIRNYLKHYFIRVAEEKKALALVSWPKGNAVPAVDAPPLSARTDEDVHAVLFNTGLRSAEYFRELYVLLYREVGSDGRKWSASSTVLTPCRATASAFRNPKSLPALLVSAFGVRPEGYPGVRYGQLVQTANFLCCDSVPPQIQQFDCRVPINHDAASVEHMLDDGPARLERLPTDYRGMARGELVTRVMHGLQVSGRMACASPRLGVPHFYRPKGVECTHAGAVQLLLPVCLGLNEGKWKPDVTIALKYNGRENCYEAVTLLSLAMARQNARLVQRMDQAWLFDTLGEPEPAMPSAAAQCTPAAEAQALSPQLSPSSPPPPPALQAPPASSASVETNWPDDDLFKRANPRSDVSDASGSPRSASPSSASPSSASPSSASPASASPRSASPRSASPASGAQPGADRPRPTISPELLAAARVGQGTADEPPQLERITSPPPEEAQALSPAPPRAAEPIAVARVNSDLLRTRSPPPSPSSPPPPPAPPAPPASVHEGLAGAAAGAFGSPSTAAPALAASAPASSLGSPSTAGGGLFGSPASATASPFAPAPAASSRFGSPPPGQFVSQASMLRPPAATAPIPPRAAFASASQRSASSDSRSACAATALPENYKTGKCKVFQ
jgi:hypothetical protein